MSAVEVGQEAWLRNNIVGDLMQYTMLGKTGFKVSRFGFGAMRLPMNADNTKVNRELAIPMIHRAFEAGVNYIDSAVMYCGHDSENTVGEALKGWRDRIVVSTKNHYLGEDEKEWRTNLENSLKRLNVDFIDIYNTHGINGKSLDESVLPRVSRWLLKARDEGLIKHICTSFHDKSDALRKVIDCGLFESITLQYNMLDRQLEDMMAYAHAKNIGIVVMGPVGGGRLGIPNDVLGSVFPDIKRIPELALRFVLANPNVTVAISGMSTMAQVEENLATASDERTFTDNERQIISQQLDRLKQMADLYCTGCGYCMPCPQEIDIPRIFRLYNNARVYGFQEKSKGEYSWWRKKRPEGGMQSDACTECGACEEKCPQKLPIRQQLKEAHKALI
jgi:uncharacterized protein